MSADPIHPTEPESAAPRLTSVPATGRAGRNLPAAIAVAVILASLVIGTLYTYRPLFVLLVVAAIMLAVHEVAQAFARRGVHVQPVAVYAGGLAIVASPYWLGAWGMVGCFVAAMLVALALRLREGADGFTADIGATAFTLAWVPLLASFAVLLAAQDNGAALVIAFICLTTFNDIGGYATGVLFGKHPMAPTLSPKKSWEGFTGSLVLQALVGVGLAVWLLQESWWKGLVLGLILTVTATLGDFVESAVKRDLGVKDMGHLLPGHGGMMDRLDSLLFNAPVAFALFALLLR